LALRVAPPCGTDAEWLDPFGCRFGHILLAEYHLARIGRLALGVAPTLDASLEPISPNLPRQGPGFRCRVRKVECLTRVEESGADHQPSGGRLRTCRREDGDRGRPLTQLAHCPGPRKEAPSALALALDATVFGSETAARVISDLMRLLGSTVALARCHSAAYSPTRSYYRVRWREHGRSATADARADANAGLRPGRSGRPLR
jgi:hypothetical protein